MRILIAEDQATSALFVRRTLEHLGHEVTVACDGREAWEKFQRKPTPVLISDWMMPEMDGLELCRMVRGAGGLGYTYYILLTSKDRRQDRLEALRNGADDFLTKPVDADELVVRLSVAERILAVHEALERQNALLAELATIDELTGVKNRRRFHEDIEMFCAVAVRREMPLSLVMLDVDHFKQYNDSYGHPAGDAVLRSVAAVLRDTTRSQDVVCRYGGEEFAVLLPSTGAADAEATAERLRHRLETFDWPFREVTASFGVATTGLEVTDSETLVETADKALYASKHAGRNRVTSARQAPPASPPAAAFAGETVEGPADTQATP